MSLRQDQWMEVGTAFEQSVNGMSRSRLASSGLCYGMKVVSQYTYEITAIGKAGDFDSTQGYSPELTTHWDAEGKLERALFAYLMAAMTDAERDAIVEGL